MEAPDAAFPIRHTTHCLDIKGHKTNIIISSYEDHFLVMATQIGSMGTILHARKEESVSVDPTFTVNVVFGKRDEVIFCIPVSCLSMQDLMYNMSEYLQPMLVACARQLVEHISKRSGKALVLSLGLRDHSMGMLKGIVSAVIEKLAEIS